MLFEQTVVSIQGLAIDLAARPAVPEPAQWALNELRHRA
jgi:hypothetical protein